MRKEADRPTESDTGGLDQPAEGAHTNDAELDELLRRAASVGAARRARLPPGTRFGRYVIEGALGAGGMGSVYRATDETLRRRVAIKTMHSNDAANAARLLREARAAAALDHPNVVAIFDVGEHEGTPFLAMELVEGTCLRTSVGDRSIAVGERIRWLIEIARALSAAHASGLVHRDVKPDNVMIRTDGVVKVLDFGIARSTVEPVDPSAPTSAGGLGTLTRGGGVVGTPLYMAPEQIRGGKADARSDQFAWGVLAYELLTGEPPWQAQDVMGLAAAIASDDLPAMSLPEGCPPAVELVVRRSLEKKPGARFAVMADVVAALDATFSGSTPSLDPLPSPAPRRRRIGWAIGAVVIVAMVGAGRSAGLFRSTAAAVSSAAAPALSSSAPADASALAAPTTLTDLPLPESSSPEAKSSYSAGLQQLRDGNWIAAKTAFAEAARLDSTMAAAYLRLALIESFIWEQEQGRIDFAKAYQLRDQLSERDQAYLEALEPIAQRLRINRTEASRRAAKLTERYPNDVEFHLYLAEVAMGDPETALRAAVRARQLDPKLADAWQVEGEMLHTLGRVDEARTAYEAGSIATSASGDVLNWLAELEADEGRCSAFESAVRREMDRRVPSSVPDFSAVLYTNGQSSETIREALEGHWSSIEDGSIRESTRLNDEALFAAISGDFETARARWEGLATIAAKSNELVPRYRAAVELVRVALETGRDDDAAAIASAFASRSEVLSLPFSFSPIVNAYIPWIFRIATRGGHLSIADFEVKRRAWVESSRLLAGVPLGLVWEFGYAAAADTEGDVHAARAVRREFEPTELSSLRHTDLTDGTMGHYDLLAGDLASATRRLKHAAANCAPLFRPILHTWALLDLGLALEQQKDKPGACEAFGRVIARWGKAKPRSVSAEKARERSVALGCPDKK